jgi:ABC-type Fe3+-hydroxamate transport system substrate-binding protein
MSAGELWEDDVGTGHAPASGSVRILSLVPSLTELLFEMQLGDQVVGRTSYCVHPADRAGRVPAVGGTKRIHLDRALALRPTHAIVNVDENPKSIADDLSAAGVEVVATHPILPMDNVRLFQLIGGVFRRRGEAERLTARFLTELARLQSRRGTRRERRVLYLIWKSPWMTASRDTYVSQMLALVDWRTVGHDDRVRYPTVDLDAVLSEVDLVLLASEPYAFKPSDVDAFRREHPHYAGQVRWVDGERLSWYGSRSILGLRYLAELAAGDEAVEA